MTSREMLTETLCLLEPIEEWGTVPSWLAFDVALGAAVTVQLGFEEDGDDAFAVWQRFRAYACGPARLRSARLAEVLDCGLSADGRMFAASERIHGVSLTRHLQQHGPLSLTQVGQLISQAGQALALAHRRGFVHGGMCADNVVLLRSDPMLVKLTELGRAGRRPPAFAAGELPFMRHLYASPEQVAHREVTPQSDVWALGVLAYHALCGELPFGGGNQAALALAICDASCPRPALRRGPQRVVARRLEAWFQKALAKHPAERFAGAEEAVNAWRLAAASSYDDEDFAVPAVSFADHAGPDSATSIAPWLAGDEAPAQEPSSWHIEPRA